MITGAATEVLRNSGHPQRKLREILRDYEDGLMTSGYGYTVADAVRDWLAFGLIGRDADTITKCTILANTHVIPALGARKLRELTADDVDRWLADKAKIISTRTLQEVRSVLKRSITRAQARDKVKRNVVLLSEVPQGRTGRPSKSLTLAQAEALLEAAKTTSLNAFIVLSLLTGARTEELRPLTWAHVDLDGDPPSIRVGAQFGLVARPRPRSHAGRWHCHSAAWTCCAITKSGSKSERLRATGGKTTTSCFHRG
jgi:hypothetical protein